ncbi:hypothetical protein BGZ57DRAFT_889691 [Hyaloscypha finlandica]|nr:hypothetical protein BGZ57DRAFT_889691 [Hyaloscypha finlandica]
MAALSGPLPTTSPSVEDIPSRSLSTDTKVNLIIGIFTIVIGALSTLFAWAMWRLTEDRRRRCRHESPTVDSNALQVIPEPKGRMGYEVTLKLL